MICIVRFLLRRQCFGALTVVAAAAAACHCLPCCIGIRHQQPSSRRRHNEPAARPWPCNTNSAVLPRSGVDETTAHDYTSRGIPPHAPSSRQLGFLRSGSAREPRAQAGLAWLGLTWVSGGGRCGIVYGVGVVAPEKAAAGAGAGARCWERKLCAASCLPLRTIWWGLKACHRCCQKKKSISTSVPKKNAVKI